MWVRTTVGWKWLPVKLNSQGISIIITEDELKWGRLSNNSNISKKI